MLNLTFLKKGPVSAITALLLLVSSVSAGKLIVWNGDTIGTEQSSGWNSPTNMSVLKPVPKTGVDGTTGLKFSGSGPDWIGFGWSWFSWYPAGAGTDITGFTRLIFKIKFDVGSPNKLPSPDSITVNLACSGGKGGKSDTVKLNAYAPGFMDGKWHDVAIPIKDFSVTEQSKQFNPKKVWEIDLGEWSPEKVTFTLTLDDIGFDSLATSK